MDLVQLHEILSSRFSAEELQALCFQLQHRYGVDDLKYEDLEGQGAASKARALVEFLHRRDRIQALLVAGSQLRPDIGWPAMAPGGIGVLAAPRRMLPASPQGNEQQVETLLTAVWQTLMAGRHEPAVPIPGQPPDAFETTARMIVTDLAEGRLIPFLGADINLSGRPSGEHWQRGVQYLPSSSELAAYLSAEFGYPKSGLHDDLVRVSQYITVMLGSGRLYDKLRELFDADYPPTPLHIFLATLPGVLRAKRYPPRPLLIVTTTYDDILERAFRAVSEPFDLVTYAAEGEQQRGKFWHWPPNEVPRLIELPNEYRSLLQDRPTILKLHGAVDRTDPERDSYVITEDHYIDYLTRGDLTTLVPVALARKLRKGPCLFLGYGLRDWNLRVILHRIWGAQKISPAYKSWAIQRDPQPLDLEFWRTRGVEVLDVQLEAFVAALSERVLALPLAQGAT